MDTCLWLISLFRPHKTQQTIQLFPQAENGESNEEDEAVSEQVAVPTEKEMEDDDDENPFKIKQHPL